MSFIAGMFIAVFEEDRPVRVRSRNSLAEEPETAVILGEAPDGLTLALHVQRRASVEYALLSALGHPPKDSLAPPVRSALEALEEAVRAEARAAGVVELEGTRAYLTSVTVGLLFGATLLTRALGAHSPLILPDDRHSPSSAPELVANTAAVALRNDPEAVLTPIATARHVAVPLDGQPPVCVDRPRDGRPHEGRRPLQLEDLSRLPSARFHALRGRREIEGSLGDEEAYELAVREADSMAWSVSRADLGRVIVQLANELQPLHEAGRVHCDIKPANILMTASGAQSIDPVVVQAGQIAPAATPGWAAPELVLARPVSPASDVYSLGLLAARLVEAAIYGEERSYVIPTGGAERRRVRLLADPEVFIDPTHVTLTEPGRHAWQSFLSRCVAFEPERRPQSALELASALEELLESHPLQGRLGLKGGPGRLTRNVEIVGRLQPSWLLADRR
jgi:protein kinase-like protein